MFEAPATPAGASLQPGLLPGPISGASPRAPLPGSLAVVIPARNAAATIGACLAALAASERPVGTVIVVDDASTDDTGAIALAAGAQLIVNRQVRGAAESRNIGASVSGADLLVFVDADVAVAPDAIGRLEQAFASEPMLAAAFGSYDDAPHARNVASLYGNLRHHYVHAREREGAEATTFWTGLGAVRGCVFEKLGGFEPGRMAIEDIEFGMRASAAGLLIRIFPSAQCKHLKRWTVASLMRTDIFVRAIPWAELILSGNGPDTALNLRLGERLSAVAAWMAVVFALATGFFPPLWVVAAYGLAMWLAMQLGFLRLLMSTAGWKTLPVLGLHFLYYLYASVSFASVSARNAIAPRSWMEPEPSPAAGRRFAL